MSPLDGGSCIPDSVFWDCRGFYFFIRGVWFGAILVLVLEFVVVRRLLLGPSGLGAKSAVVRSRSEEAAPPGTAPPAAEQFPENVVAWLKKATLPSGNVEAAARGMVDASPTETCFFMNVYVHRYFLELRRSELLKARWKLKVLEKLAHRMESLSMISSLTFTDFDFGVNPPMFHGARVLKYHSDRAEITLELDTTYKGGLTVGIEVTLATGGITIPVVVKLTGLAGRASFSARTCGTVS
ncbi:hypothetical protein DFJ74DRAFT_137911 [Hyaloraphidium curvatum]|nr:hypothetical protein DFJ74DRAFT_137911 [Hyaloraphidium curvatum]